MPAISSLWRYPIKAHGRESLSKVTLTAGQTLPGDRKWAVAHDAAKTEGGEWAPCANFSRGAKAPGLMAVTASLDEAENTITLRHPDQGDITFDPDGDVGAFLDWVRPLMPANRAQSVRVVTANERGMTDTPFPSISMIGHASLDALAEQLEQTVEPERFRANVWIDGLEPFEEFGWVGKDLQIGDVRLHVEERIERCLATTANPATGIRDVDTLGGLMSGWGHKELGIYAQVVQGGTIAPGDTIVIL